jgi:hypothetical protein
MDEQFCFTFSGPGKYSFPSSVIGYPDNNQTCVWKQCSPQQNAWPFWKLPLTLNLTSSAGTPLWVWVIPAPAFSLHKLVLFLP